MDRVIGGGVPRDESNSAVSMISCSSIKEERMCYQSSVHNTNIHIYVKEYSDSKSGLRYFVTQRHACD